MKSLLLAAVLLSGLNALAQKHISITHSITDDGNTLSIVIKGTANGKAIDYNRVFDVSSMSAVQRNALRDRVYDSLGLRSPTPPHEPMTPHEPLAPVEATTPIAPTPAMISATSGYNELSAIGGDHPYTKEIKYNPETGLLYMRYRFIKNKEEVSMEKSTDVRGKSKEERDRLIKKYEWEIGITKPEVI